MVKIRREEPGTSATCCCTTWPSRRRSGSRTLPSRRGRSSAGSAFAGAVLPPAPCARLRGRGRRAAEVGL